MNAQTDTLHPGGARRVVRPADVCADAHAVSSYGRRYALDEIAEHLEQLEVRA